MATQTNSVTTVQSAERTALADRLLFQHPREVGESYVEHAAIAARFGFAMIAGGLRCLVHAAVPGVQKRAASDTVDALHRQLQKRRRSSSVDHDYVI